MSARDFDQRARQFSEMLRAAADWKQNFFGAAYSTRITQAIALAKQAIADAEELLHEDAQP